MTILPVLEEGDESLAPHWVCPPKDEEEPFRIAVFQTEDKHRYFDVPDLASLLEALNYNEDMFAETTWHALNVMEMVVDHYMEQLWSTRDEEIPGDCEDLRREIVELVRTCCAQEGALLKAAKVGIEKALQ